MKKKTRADGEVPDEVRARRIAYDIRVNNLTQEQVVMVLIGLIEDVRAETHDQYEM